MYIKKSISCGNSSIKTHEKNATNKINLIHRLMLRFMSMKPVSIPDARAKGSRSKSKKNASTDPRKDCGAADADSRSSHSGPFWYFCKNACIRLSAADLIPGDAAMLVTIALSRSKSAMLYSDGHDGVPLGGGAGKAS